jgi:4-hydroxybutyryl-CoA dehydratase/vinylacetyl-CoA-Delta-isomerase
VEERTALVERLLDRGVLDEGRRVSKQPGRCCDTGCATPKPMMPELLRRDAAE